MKVLLILWAIGLAECDKLDRTYLPPPGSVAAGGDSEVLNLPLESYFSTLKPTSDVLTPDSSYYSKFPNIALGIDRKGPSVTGSARFFTNSPVIPVSNIYNLPTTTSSYDLTQQSTLSPIETYGSSVGPMTKVSQEYSSTSSPFDPNLTYDQYLFQQILKPNKSSQSISTVVPSDTVSKLPKENIAQTSITGSSSLPAENNQQVSNSSIQNPFSESNVNEYLSGQLDESGAPESQFANINTISTNITPHSLSKLSKYESDLVNRSDELIPNVNDSYPDKFHNQQTLASYFFQLAPDVSDGIKSSTETAVLSDTHSSTPTFLNENFGTFYSTSPQIQRIQAIADKNADILSYKNILTPNSFEYSFDTSNGIHVDESGTANNGVKAKGAYSYTGDDGKLYTVEYTADENGFVPRGDHLPTAPPIPNAILRGIEQAEKNKKIGIIDDGSYDEAKYGHDRYQGLKNRKLQNYEHDNIVSQPVVKENKQQSETASFKNVDLPGNNGQVLDTTNLGAPFTSPNKSKMIDLNNKYSYIVMDVNQPNRDTLLSFDDENINNKSINKPRNKFRGDIITNSAGINENLDQNSIRNLGILSPMDYNLNVQKEYNDNDINQRFHSGYEYIQPQNIFDDNDRNNFESQFTSLRKNDELDRDEDTRDERIPGKSIINPNVSFNFRNQTPTTEAHLLGKTFSDPLTTPGNTYSIDMLIRNNGIKPNIPTFYNRESDPIRDGENIVTERVFSTLEPKYGSTTLKPYNYQTSYTTNGNNEQHINYPSSTIRSEYSISTTSLPSKIPSSFPTTTNFNYSQTTPTVTLVTPTSRPSITSERPTTRITLRPSGYTDRVSELEQVEDSRISTTRPKTSNQRIIGRPGYQVRPKVPVTRTGFSEDLKPGSGVSTDTSSQKLNASSRPENFRSQSTEKAIGEDFTGPKQPQRFDPKYGYYY